MQEKVYKIMKGTGTTNIVVGVVVLAVGVASGILLVISGAKLIAGKSKILFQFIQMGISKGDAHFNL